MFCTNNYTARSNHGYHSFDIPKPPSPFYFSKELHLLPQLTRQKGTFTFEEYQQIKNENVEIINDDSTYPFISYLTDLLAKSKPSDAAVKKLHDLIDQIAAATGHDSTDIFRVLLAKLIEKPDEQQTFDTLLELAEKIAAKH